MSSSLHETWSSRLTFILVSVGATVGFGNLWKFPYTAGSNGGGAFVLVYLIAIFMIATPLFMNETLIGRCGRMSPAKSLKKLALESGSSSHWQYVGWIGFVISILVLSFASVFSGVAFAYIFKGAAGEFTGASAAEISTIFRDFMGNPFSIGLWHTLFVLVNIWIVGRGIRRGIEQSIKMLLPALLVILVLLVIYAGVNGDLAGAVNYLFAFDVADLTPSVVLAAFGQAFFTMSLGVGGVLIFGAYLGNEINIGKASLTIALSDTLVALLAGLAIFPVVFAHGLNPAEGPGLLFVTLPIAFASMPWGNLMGIAFFVLFLFASVTSTISLLEVSVSYLEERYPGKRMQSAAIMGGVFWLVGFGTIFSFNIWADWHPLSFIPTLEEAHVFGIIDHLVSNIWLPIGGLAFSLFAGWVLPKSRSMQELGLGSGLLYKAWLITARFIAPLVILAIFLVNLI